MVNKFEVEGFEAFVSKVEALKSTGNSTFVLFSGSVDPSTGKSWCPDCVVAYPVIQAALEKTAPANANFLYVSVGPRDFWKDKNNVFRQDPRTKLRSVPTLIKYGSAQRLEEGNCARAAMVEMLFEDS